MHGQGEQWLLDRCECKQAFMQTKELLRLLQVSQDSSPPNPLDRSHVFHSPCADNTDLESLLEQLAAAGVKVDKQADGIIVQRWGALGRSKSIYIRDPDSNIIEVKTYDSSMTLNLA